MRNKLILILKSVLGIALGLALLYLSFRDRTLDDIVSDLEGARWMWVLLSYACLFCSHWFRAMRWKMMLAESGHHANLPNTFAAILVAYMVNNAVPRLGEIARCSMLKRSDNIPISASGGTVISERLFDMLILLLCVLLVFILEFNRLSRFFTEAWLSLTNVLSPQALWLILGAFTALSIGSIVLLRRHRERLVAVPLIERIQDFLRKLYHAATSIFALKRSGMFFVHTAVLWLLLIVMTYLIFLSLPETESLSFYFAAVLFIIGGLGWVLPSPGGIGSYHYIVIHIFVVFDYTETWGQNYATIAHSSAYVLTILIGFLAWLFLLFRSGNKTAEA